MRKRTLAAWLLALTATFSTLAHADRLDDIKKAGVLRVDAVHEDEPLDSTARDDVQQAIEGLAGWLGLAVERAGRAGR